MLNSVVRRRGLLGGRMAKSGANRQSSMVEFSIDSNASLVGCPRKVCPVECDDKQKHKTADRWKIVNKTGAKPSRDGLER